MLEVVGAYRVRVQVDAPQVDDPQQLRRVAHHDLLRRPARRKAQLHRLDPVGVLRGGPLLEERLALRAVHVALEHDRPRRDPSQRPVGDRHVVLRQVELRVTGLRKEHLVRVGDHHLATGDCQDGLRRPPHGNSVAELTVGASPRGAPDAFRVADTPAHMTGGMLVAARGDSMHTAELILALLIAVAAAAAVVARALIPDLTWPVALALGAIVAPPDAIAATAIASRLAVPRRIITILEGESLLNDATALTLYSIAVATAVGGGFSPTTAVVTFTGAMLGGGAIGVAVGWVIAQIRKRLEDTPVEITISLLTPYAAFLPADRLGASGVIATVAAGLYRGHRGSRIMGADARLTGRAVWETLTFLLNGFVFIVMGLEVPLLLRAVTPSLAIRLVGIGLGVSLILVVVRALFIFGTVLAPQLVRTRQDMRWLSACSLVLSWAGMRGVGSLAAAL